MMPSHVAFPTIGVVMIVLGIPLMLRWVRPNRWYGLRVPATFANETVWYDANAATGAELVVAGVIVLAVAVLARRVFDLPEIAYVAVCVLALVVTGVTVARRGIARAGRLGRERGGGAARARPDL
jgi:uncharacterized membrane protein